MIYITGDTHGTLDVEKLCCLRDKHDDLSADDYLIICGDVAVCGLNGEDDQEVRDIFNSLPVTVLFVDGNHENFDDLNSFPISSWNGGDVHFIEERIIHLMRGQVFRIDGKTFFTMGGAHSIDYMYREPYVDWYPEELPDENELELGIQNLNKNDWQVDYIITHTGPTNVIAEMGYEYFNKGNGKENDFRRYLQSIADRTDFKKWFFGHFHEDLDIGEQFHCVFDDIIRLPE